MDRYSLIGIVVGLVVFLGSIAMSLAGEGSLGAFGLVARALGAGLAGFVTVTLLRNFGPD